MTHVDMDRQATGGVSTYQDTLPAFLQGRNTRMTIIGNPQVHNGSTSGTSLASWFSVYHWKKKEERICKSIIEAKHGYDLKNQYMLKIHNLT